MARDVRIASSIRQQYFPILMRHV